MAKSQKKIRLIMALVVLLITVFLVNRAYHRRALFQQVRDATSHTHQVKHVISGVGARIRDLELGQRGYLLTLDSEFLEPYRLAIGSHPGQRAFAPESVPLLEQIRVLDSLVADNPRQVQNLRRLEALVAAKLRFTDSTLKVLNEQGSGAAILAIQSKHGKTLMDGIRKAIDEMMHEEDSLLADRKFAEDSQLANNGAMLYGMVIFLYILSMLALWLASRSSDSRRLAEQALKKSHQLLGAIIDGTEYAILAGDAKGILRVYNKGA